MAFGSTTPRIGSTWGRVRDDACHAPGDRRWLCRLRDGGAPVGGARKQGRAAGGGARLPAGPDARRHPRHLFGQRADEPELFLEGPEGTPQSGCRAGLLRARSRARRRVVGQRAGGAARSAGGLRPLERDRRKGLGLELGAALFSPAGNRSRLHRPVAWRAGPHHRPPHADGAMGRLHPVHHQGLERTRLPTAPGHERRVRRGLLAAAAVQRRHCATFRGCGLSGRVNTAASKSANPRRDAGAADPVRQWPCQRRRGAPQRRNRDDHRRQRRCLLRRAAHAMAADAVGHRSGRASAPARHRGAVGPARRGRQPHGSSGDPHLRLSSAGGAAQDGAAAKLHLSALVLRSGGRAGGGHGDDGGLPLRLACDRHTHRHACRPTSAGLIRRERCGWPRPIRTTSRTSTSTG